MAFVNENGEKISYECSELIKELTEDIKEFGGDMIVEVVTEVKNGVTIYKDYNFIEKGNDIGFELLETESTKKMTASALLELYKIENDLF